MSYNPQIFTNRVELEEVIESQRELLADGMTSLEFFRVITVVMSAIRCGHSFVIIPSAIIGEVFDAESAYPIDVRLIEGKLYVVGIDGDTQLEFGDEIVSIDGISTQDVTADMMRYLSADGEGTAYKTIVFSQYYLYYYQLYLATEEAIDVEYIDDSTGASQSETLTRNCPNVHGWVQEEPFEATYEDDVAIMTLRTFYPEYPYTLTDFYLFFEEFFQTVASQGIHKMILDIRGNGGGDPRVASRLLSYLLPEPAPYFAPESPNYYTGLKDRVPLSEPHYDGRLATLADAFCFSTCGHFASLLQFHQVGVIIGEETGGGYTCSDTSRNFTLSNTMMQIRTSTTQWTVAVEDMTKGRGALPSIHAYMSLEDYRDEVDRVYLTGIEWLNEQE